MTVPLLLGVITLLSFFVKALTGFGPAILFISFGQLLLPAQQLIVISSLIDAVAGSILLGQNFEYQDVKFWFPLAIAIVTGAVCGSFMLLSMPTHYFKMLFSVTIFLLGGWFIFGRRQDDDTARADNLPEKCDLAGVLICFTGGFCGGLIGISGPPIIWFFGKKFAKHAFRKVLIPLFFMAAVARTVSYTSLGMLDSESLKLSLYCIPGLLIGLTLGSRAFFALNEKSFYRVVGVLLCLIALKFYL